MFLYTSACPIVPFDVFQRFSQIHEVTGCHPPTDTSEVPEKRRLAETAWSLAELLTMPSDHQPHEQAVANTAGDSAMSLFELSTGGSADPIRRRLKGAWNYVELDYSAVKYFR